MDWWILVCDYLEGSNGTFLNFNQLMFFFNHYYIELFPWSLTSKMGCWGFTEVEDIYSFEYHFLWNKGNDDMTCMFFFVCAPPTLFFQRHGGMGC